ncbi:enoyl-CoA hydratase domain-containing protein 3, mitochondrial [Onthophagus taurus]|uniref:enoyl-CoA hydratase domain-containing protein 3, mitochondrial n=1 Tax=Onthophagus taurus TaxID=166361 RepID=UPI000C20EB63|nr:enoyl-CoA hydratase domain-containing protein 3, mitochondrial [Onthophagus taurus]
MAFRTTSYLLSKFGTQNLTKVSLLNGVQNVIMCDSKTRNSLSTPMMDNLINSIREGGLNDEVRVIVLSSEGPVFSAGHNFKELLPELGRKEHEKVFNKCAELMMSIVESPVPVIAKINGVAAAAGCQLVAQCDMAICTTKSSFSTPGATFGIFCSTPGIPLARCVPKMNALQMLFTGLPISAQEAKQIGLVSKLSTEESLQDDLDVITSAIISKSRAVIELGKRFYYKQIQFDLKSAYEMGGTTMVDNINLPDGQEGVKSFIEKRKAKWVK